MGHGKQKIKNKKRTKLWKILSGTYRQKKASTEVDRLVAAIQQELEWDKTDITTWMKIEKGMLDWSGNVRSKRKPRKHIRKRR